MEKNSSRRSFVKQAAAGLGLLPLSSLAELENISSARTLNIVCVGGHPDDPESGCGGTLAKFASSGHLVTIIYLTRGEAGIEGKSNAEAAAIRSREAEEACKIIKAKPVFAGQTDGDSIMNNEWIIKLKSLVENEKPDIVFTHWPIDSHKDHQVASLLAIQTWMRSNSGFDLYFFEVCAGSQTMGFRPTDFVDISEFQELKRKAVYCHTSQDPPSIYQCGHAAMEEFRGRELGVKAGEGFVRMTGRKRGNHFEPQDYGR
ncbi:MAG: PIG-L deacetylase family protein [Chitinophagales bacterium]